MTKKFDAKKYLGTFWAKGYNFYFRQAGKKNVRQLTDNEYLRMSEKCNFKNMEGKKGFYWLIYKK